jgi:hypothetical protein
MEAIRATQENLTTRPEIAYLRPTMKRSIYTLIVLAFFVPAQAARADAGQTLHVLIAADTTDKSIGASVQMNVKHLTEDVRQIAEYSKQKLKLHVIPGEQLTSVEVLKAVNALKPGKNDTVLFLYSGHGGRLETKKGSYPDLCFHDKWVGLEEIFRILRGKNPRLLLVFSDSCNSVPGEQVPDLKDGQVPEYPEASLKKEGYRKLFARQRGAVIGAGTRAREFGIYYGEGGVYTNSLRAAIKSAAASSSPDWRGVMRRASQPLQWAKNLQRPIYKVYADSTPEQKTKTKEKKAA